MDHLESETRTSGFCDVSFGLQSLLFGSLIFIVPFHASNIFELQISSCFPLP
jgi:hypothetical protein